MGLFFLVLKSHTIAPPKTPKIKPRGPVMNIPSKGLWVESLKIIWEIKPLLNNLTDSLVLGR